MDFAVMRLKLSAAFNEMQFSKVFKSVAQDWGLLYDSFFLLVSTSCELITLCEQ
jgi:hypothetical protein